MARPFGPLTHSIRVRILLKPYYYTTHLYKMQEFFYNYLKIVNLLLFYAFYVKISLKVRPKQCKHGRLCHSPKGGGAVEKYILRILVLIIIFVTVFTVKVK